MEVPDVLATGGTGRLGMRVNVFASGVTETPTSQRMVGTGPGRNERQRWRQVCGMHS